MPVNIKNSAIETHHAAKLSRGSDVSYGDVGNAAIVDSFLASI
jgi:hypothetical protein